MVSTSEIRFWWTWTSEENKDHWKRRSEIEGQLVAYMWYQQIPYLWMCVYQIILHMLILKYIIYVEEHHFTQWPASTVVTFSISGLISPPTQTETPLSAIPGDPNIAASNFDFMKANALWRSSFNTWFICGKCILQRERGILMASNWRSGCRFRSWTGFRRTRGSNLSNGLLSS